MATLNAAATLEQATDFGTNYAGATLEVRDGATVCATFTITSWTPTNTGNDGTATAVIAAPVTIAVSGNPVDSAVLISGTEEITLTVGTSGAEINWNTLNFVSGETATLSSLVFTFPAT